MAEEKALVFDTGIDKSGLEKGLAEIEESILKKKQKKRLTA